MIPTKPPPSFRNPDKWSPEFIDFVSKCLVKNPEQRASAQELLQVGGATETVKHQNLFIRPRSSNVNMLLYSY